MSTKSKEAASAAEVQEAYDTATRHLNEALALAATDGLPPAAVAAALRQVAAAHGAASAHATRLSRLAAGLPADPKPRKG